LRRALAQDVELDDDRGRVDADAVHRYLREESYWARGRSREDVVRSIRDAARVVGLYQDRRLIGFARVISDGVHVAHLCDVYVLSAYRGRGFGVELVREAVDNGPHADLGWTLATKDAQGLYQRFGFSPRDKEVMQRKRTC
jgi:ribosomal protein S18 acetylase RimI-like enzyme